MAALAPGSRFLFPFSTLPFVKRYRNGCASAGEPIFAPFSTLLSVKRHCNSCAGAKELIFVPLFNAAVCQAPSQ
jgi:hypothetical protein